MSIPLVVAGALGVVGDAVRKHFEGCSDKPLICLSRREAVSTDRVTSYPVDLSRSGDLQAKVGQIHGDVDLVYCALAGRTSGNDTWSEAAQIEANRVMLANCLDGIRSAGGRLRHVVLLQGAKAYGVHLGPVAVPSKESDPRSMHPNFYWQQEDMVRQRSEKEGWTWTIFRPQYIVGYALSSPINLLTPLLLYAAISRELGLPLQYTGSTANITEATDARLLARAVAWSLDAETARNEIFNITNGDVFTLPAIFDALAGHFNIHRGPDACAPLSVLMDDKEPVWQAMIAKYGLVPNTLADLAGSSWAFADAAMAWKYPFLESTIKLRQAGFHECVDSVHMFLDWTRVLQDQKVLPR